MPSIELQTNDDSYYYIHGWGKKMHEIINATLLIFISKPRNHLRSYFSCCKIFQLFLHFFFYIFFCALCKYIKTQHAFIHPLYLAVISSNLLAKFIWFYGVYEYCFHLERKRIFYWKTCGYCVEGEVVCRVKFLRFHDL